MKKCKRLLAFMLAFCMSALMAIPVWADDSDIVNEMRNGVLQVELNWINDHGEKATLQTGSGFLVNDQTLLTNQHVVEMDSATKTAKSQQYGVDFVNDTKLDVRVQIVVTRDVVVDATVIQSSREMDVAILELKEPIYDRKFLELGDSSTVKETSTVYALGFPWVEGVQDVQYYTNSDVTVTSNVVAKKTEINSIPFIQHSATITKGNSGGPLVSVGADGVGRVIGINTAYIAGEPGYYYAMEINDIKKLMDALGISYNSSENAAAANAGADNKAAVDGQTGEGDAAPAEEEQPEVTLDKAGLEAAIAQAEAKEIDGNYTEESLSALKDSLDKAYEVADDQNTSQDLVDKAQSDLETATKNLEEKSGMNWLVWVIVGAVVVIVVVVVLVVVLSSNKKAKKAAEDREREMRQRMERQRNSGNAGSPKAVSGHVNMPSSEGAGETSVLGEGRGETTVLNAGAQSNAYMIRKKNNERVAVSGPSFTIGKERSRVNYCISDNTSVSRCHARILRKGAQYFVTDMNSTNYTFVNGVKVIPGQETPVNDRDIIRFADEDFEFHTN